MGLATGAAASPSRPGCFLAIMSPADTLACLSIPPRPARPGPPPGLAQEPDAALLQALVDAAREGDLARVGEVAAAWQASTPRRAADLFFGLLLPGIRRLERLWSRDELSYERVTLAFHTLQQLLEVALGGRRPAAGGGRGLVCLSLLPGGAHRFGLCVVADALQEAGWSVRLFGGEDTDALLDTLARHEVAMLGLSLGNDRELALAPRLVASARAVSRRRPLRVLMGGNILAEPFGQYAFVDADAMALDAASAVAWAAAWALPASPTESDTP